MKWYKVRVQVSAKGIAINLYVKAFSVFRAANIVSNVLPENTTLLQVEPVIDIAKEK